LHIGIDLGTTNSLISAFGADEPKLIENSLGKVLTPSVVSLDGDTLVCGDIAKARLVTHPDQTAAAFKRTMGARHVYKLGRKRFSSAELSAVVLRSLKQDAETFLGHEIKDVVISVPAYFNELQRKAVHASGIMAGLTPKRLINEPTAAALAYGLQDLDAESNLLVFDLGGGTFDVSILEVFEGVMEVKATAGDAYLGGEDFTDKIVEHFEKSLNLGKHQKSHERSALRKIAEQAKLTLSDSPVAKVDTKIGDHNLQTELSRQDFESICANLLMRLRRPVERTLYDSDLSFSDIDRVVLVGGATRMPIIRSIVAKQLRRLPDSQIDPDHVVALGAGVQAGLVGKNQALKDVVMTDVTAFTLGTETTQQLGKEIRAGYFHPIIERNSIVPISRETVLSTVHKGQTEIKLDVYQGEAPLVSSNIFLGSLTVSVPHNRKAFEDISVRFTYDVSGLLDVDITVLSNGETKNLLITKLAGEISDKEIKSTLKKLEKFKTHPRDDTNNIYLRARIEQCYAMARLRDRDEIQDMLVIFDAAIERQEPAEIGKLREELAQALDQFEAGYVR